MENINTLKSKKILIYQTKGDIYMIPDSAKKVSLVTGFITLKDGSKKEMTYLPEEVIINGMNYYASKDGGLNLKKLESPKRSDCYRFTIKTKDGKEIDKIVPCNCTKEMNVLVDENGQMMKYHLI